jgi:hypothetical protein
MIVGAAEAIRARVKSRMSRQLAMRCWGKNPQQTHCQLATHRDFTLARIGFRSPDNHPLVFITIFIANLLPMTRPAPRVVSEFSSSIIWALLRYCGLRGSGPQKSLFILGILILAAFRNIA